jgi:hypothetical protein
MYECRVMKDKKSKLRDLHGELKIHPPLFVQVCSVFPRTLKIFQIFFFKTSVSTPF